MPDLLFYTSPHTDADAAQQACRRSRREMAGACGNTLLPSPATIASVPQCAHAMAVTDRMCCGLAPASSSLCSLDGFTSLRAAWIDADGLRAAVPVLGATAFSGDGVDLSPTRAALQHDMVRDTMSLSGVGNTSDLQGDFRDDNQHYRCLAVDGDQIVRDGMNVYAEKLFCCPYPDGKSQSTEMYLTDAMNHDIHINRYVANRRYDVATCMGESRPGETSRVLEWSVARQRYEQQR